MGVGVGVEKENELTFSDISYVPGSGNFPFHLKLNLRI